MLTAIGVLRRIGRAIPCRTAADTVTIGFGSSSNTFTVTENAASASATSLKIDGDAQGAQSV